MPTLCYDRPLRGLSRGATPVLRHCRARALRYTVRRRRFPMLAFLRVLVLLLAAGSVVSGRGMFPDLPLVRRANAWQRCLYGVELDHGTASVDIRTTPTPTATVNFRTGSFTGTPHLVPIAASAGWVVQPTGVSATSAGFIARSVTGGTGSSTMTVYWHAMRRLF